MSLKWSRFSKKKTDIIQQTKGLRMCCENWLTSSCFPSSIKFWINIFCCRSTKRDCIMNASFDRSVRRIVYADTLENRIRTRSFRAEYRQSIDEDKSWQFHTSAFVEKPNQRCHWNERDEYCERITWRFVDVFLARDSIRYRYRYDSIQRCWTNKYQIPNHLYFKVLQDIAFMILIKLL